jgi:N-acetylneuraminic acid mutarotase
MFSKLIWLRQLVAIMVLGLAFAGVAQAQKWVKLAPFPDASEELYGIASGGKLYVFGGLAPGWTPKGLAFEYDPATDKWTKKAAMPLVSHHVALAELNGKIYMVGGFVKPASGPSAWQPIDNLWEYDTANDSWKALAPMPTKRGSPNAAIVNGKLYVIGGAGLSPGAKETALHPARPQRVLGTNEVYDIAANKWETKSPMPTTRNHAAIGVVNNKIYVIGGRVGNAFITRASNTDVVEEYDPATDQWGDLKAPMPTGRSASAWGTYKGKIYVAGGEVRTDRFAGTFRAVEAYEPATNRWITLPPMDVARHGLAGDIVGGRLQLVSGNVQSGGPEGMVIATDINIALELEAAGK